MGSPFQYRHIAFFAVFLLALTGLTGCASTSSVTHQSAVAITPTTTKSQPSAHYALAIAVDMIGAPYRYGGTSPRGFDCSGLVYYAYRKAGIHPPRTTTEQYRQSKRVPVSHLQPGDLVFFTISQGKLSHVGIYAGDDRFIHAPSSGKSVAYATLHDPYWRGRLVGAGRIQ